LELIVNAPLDDIDPNPYQPESRLTDTMEARNTLMVSIDRDGLHQIPEGRMAPDGTRYQMVDGWRRRGAFMGLRDSGREGYAEKYARIPLVVKDLTDRQMADAVIDTNLTKQDLTSIDLAKLYSRFLSDFHLTQSALAEQRGCSQGEIANSIRLLELPEDVQIRIITREITETHGRALLQLKDNKMISLLAQEAVEKQMTVSALDARIKAHLELHKPRLIPISPDQSSFNKPIITGNPSTPPVETPVVHYVIKEDPGNQTWYVEKDGEMVSVDHPSVKDAEKWISEQTLVTPVATINVPPVQKDESTTQSPPVKTVPETTDTSTDGKAPQNAEITNKNPVVKPAITNTSTPPPPVLTAWPTKWKRRVMLEEKDGFIEVTGLALTEKGQLIKKRLDGTLETISFSTVLVELTTEWNKEK
jgi:ParB family chromosome partitioning protein